MRNQKVSRRLYANGEFGQWKQQQQQSFQEYKDSRDKEFTAFLKMQWREMQLLRGLDATRNQNR